MDTPIIIDNEYAKLIQDLKSAVRSAQLKAHRAVNSELIKLYWKIGKALLARQKVKAWGSKYLKQVSVDLKAAFPEMKGFSYSNLKNMRQFAKKYPDFSIGQWAVGQLGWGQIIDLIQKVKSKEEREWCAQQAVKDGWSRSVLNMMIKQDLYKRKCLGSGVTNFDVRLPSPQSDLANEMIQDPFAFHFYNSTKDLQKKAIEHSLVSKVSDFLTSMGKAFSFVGSQYHLEVGGDDFYIDILLFNMEMNCYFVVELKIGKFKPEHTGKLNFYVSAVDGLLKREHHNPTIGLLLCQTKNAVVAEFSLKNISTPLDITEYQLGAALTQHLKQENLLVADEAVCVS